MKKADMTIETIIKFVLVLAVVGVLLFLVYDKFSLFEQSNNCEERGGSCTEDCNGKTLLLAGCENEEVCCISIT
ncbi:hypothetical protein HQ529_05580 [Candidatus Woesearchaeota archaeon]|nr:hypothetical protein [Candidatus Woesearchaeota archaeon]